MFVQLKPRSQRTRLGRPVHPARRGPSWPKVQDVNVYLQASQDLTFGGRLSRTQYQYTLTSLDAAELNHWAPILEQRMRGLSKLQDNASDQQIAARHLAVEVDRDTASRLGVSLAAIDQTLYDTFGERQVATIYSATTQYKVLLESAGQFERGPAALSRLYVPGAGRRAGAAQHRGALRRHGRAAHHQSPGPVPGGDAVLQPGAGRVAQRGGGRRSTSCAPSSTCRPRSTGHSRAWRRSSRIR